MFSLRALTYLIAITLPITVAISFLSSNAWTFFPVIYAFGVVPMLELFFKPSEKNLTTAEREIVRQDRTYDLLLYLMVPLQWGFVLWFLLAMSTDELPTYAVVGRTLSLGMMCGVIGINVAHELGHRSSKFEQGLSKALLLSSLYLHFFIEHNRGHHRNVATHDDPATARKNEWVFLFWVRTIVLSWLHAWKLERTRLQRTNTPVVSLHNEMIRFQLIQLVLLGTLFFFAGGYVMLLFVGAAATGMLLLETVNYIEHYGLLRQKRNNGKYERVMPVHSWNSNHVVGRLMLFELSRHSDHHYKASTPYHLLSHIDEAPQLPTGYPGMMLLSLFPPLFFHMMNKRVEGLQDKSEVPS